MLTDFQDTGTSCITVCLMEHFSFNRLQDRIKQLLPFSCIYLCICTVHDSVFVDQSSVFVDQSNRQRFWHTTSFRRHKTARHTKTHHLCFAQKSEVEDASPMHTDVASRCLEFKREPFEGFHMAALWDLTLYFGPCVHKDCALYFWSRASGPHGLINQLFRNLLFRCRQWSYPMIFLQICKCRSAPVQFHFWVGVWLGGLVASMLSLLTPWTGDWGVLGGWGSGRAWLGILGGEWLCIHIQIACG